MSVLIGIQNIALDACWIIVQVTTAWTLQVQVVLRRPSDVYIYGGGRCTPLQRSYMRCSPAKIWSMIYYIIITDTLYLARDIPLKNAWFYNSRLRASLFLCTRTCWNVNVQCPIVSAGGHTCTFKMVNFLRLSMWWSAAIPWLSFSDISTTDILLLARKWCGCI